MAMTLDMLTIICIASGLAAGLVCVVLFIRADRRREASAIALAPRLSCPRCGTSTLQFAGWWLKTTSGGTGPNYRCVTCGEDCSFSLDGKIVR